jgi:integrase
MLGVLEDKKAMVNKLTENSRLSTLIDYYLDSKSYRNLSATSQKEYELNLRVIRSDLGGVLLSNMSTTQVEAAYDKWIRNGIPRANKLAAILSIVLNKGIGLGIRIVNPVPHMDRVPNPPRKITWEPEQVKAFLLTAYKEWTGYSIGLIVHMAYEWGQRVGDMRLLTWDALDLENSRMDLTQSKRGADVHLPISDGLKSILEEQQKRFGFQQYVAPKTTAVKGVYRPYAKPKLHMYVNRIKEQAGLPKELTAMDMRRTAITEMVEAGVDITQIKQVSGHTNIQSLTPYIKHTFTGASEALAQRNAFKKDKL